MAKTHSNTACTYMYMYICMSKRTGKERGRDGENSQQQQHIKLKD